MKKLQFTYSNGITEITIKGSCMEITRRKAEKKLKGSVTLIELKY